MDKAKQVEFLPVRTEDDISHTAALAKEIWTEHYLPLLGQSQIDYMLDRFQSVRAISEQLAEGKEYYFICLCGETVGYFAVDYDNPPGKLFLSKLYVRKDARGNGLSRDVLGKLRELAAARGLHSVWLTVNKHNPSVEVYKRLGMRVVNSAVSDIGCGYVMDDYYMEIEV